MKKAVLIIDMPNSCKDGCEWYGGNYCERMGIIWKEDNKPDWCPLRPLPEEHTTLIENSYAEGRRDGWNDCLKKIIGDE